MTQIGSVYGEALYELAKDEACVESVYTDLLALEEGFQAEPDFLKLLSSPNLSKQERCQILDDSFRGKIQPYLLSFLKILTEKGYIKQFSHCCEQYVELYNQDHNILSVKAVTAVAFTEKQQTALVDKLAQITGKTIQLKVSIDPNCLGGVRLDYDGQRLDGTVIRRLANVRDLLKNTVL